MIARCHPWLRLRAHAPERVGLLGWRCTDCAAVAETEGELLGDSGFVSIERREFVRDPRYVTRAA